MGLFVAVLLIIGVGKEFVTAKLSHYGGDKVVPVSSVTLEHETAVIEEGQVYGTASHTSNLLAHEEGALDVVVSLEAFQGHPDSIFIVSPKSFLLLVLE